MTPETGRSLLRKHWRTVQVALIMLAGAAVYSRTFQVPFVFDDYYCINLIGQQNFLGILLHGGPRRVTDLTFAFNFRLNGLQVAGYHLVNLAVHLAAAVALYFLVTSSLAALRNSFSRQTETGFVDRFVPLAVALLFVVHPVQTQAVTYIIQRYTSLTTLFYLLSALFFIRTRLAIEKNDRLIRVLFPGAIALATGLLALGSKQIAATLPLMLLVLEITLFRGRMLGRRFFFSCAALLAFVILYGIFAWHDSSLDDFLYDVHRATSEDLFTPRMTYLLTQTRVIVSYLGLLFLPLNQNLMPDSPVYSSPFILPVMSSVALHVTLSTSALLLFHTSRRHLMSHDLSKGTLQRLFCLGIAWFYIAMIVESSVFPIRDVIFEHRVYLPSAGFFIGIASLAALLLNGWGLRYRLAYPIIASVCLALGGLTIARNQVWNSPLTLWHDTVRKSPNKFLAQAFLGSEYLARNKPDKALPFIVRAIELKPGIDPSTILDLGKSLQGLPIDPSRFTTGKEFVSAGKIPGTVELDYRNLAAWESSLSNNMGLAYEYLGNPAAARDAYRNALWANPDYDLALYNLGLLAKKTGDEGQAVIALRELQRLKSAMADRLEDVVRR